MLCVEFVKSKARILNFRVEKASFRGCIRARKYINFQQPSTRNFKRLAHQNAARYKAGYLFARCAVILFFWFNRCLGSRARHSRANFVMFAVATRNLPFEDSDREI